MTRLPFDPSKIPEPDIGGPARREQKLYGKFEGAKPLTVTQVCELVKRIISDRAPTPLRVVGEVSNFSERGHWYLSLKDEQNSILHCVVWATAVKKCAFTPERGQQVVASGKLDYYGPQGKLQLYVDDLQPVGQGALEIRFRQLCEELRALGYFSEERKRAMPAFPEHIAIVTSANGAALHDVIKTARHRWPGVKLSVIDVKVQGEGAAQQIARAVDALSKGYKALGIDAVILTRGGGSMEDLWAFNERVVADAVFRCAVPIAVGVGHETDTSVAELVADLRCSTPTQAAARLVPDAESERHHVEQMTDRLGGALRRVAERMRVRLEHLASHRVFRRPTERFAQMRTELEHLQRRLGAAAERRVGRERRRLDQSLHALAAIEPRARLRMARREIDSADAALRGALTRSMAKQTARLEALARQLQAVGPESVLQRGYSYTTDAAGGLLRSVTQTHAGQRIVTRLSDGHVESDVVGGKPTAPEAPAGPAAPPVKKSRSKSKPSTSDDTGLFGSP